MSRSLLMAAVVGALGLTSCAVPVGGPGPLNGGSVAPAADGYVITNRPTGSEYNIYNAAAAVSSLEVLGSPDDYKRAADEFAKKVADGNLSDMISKAHVPANYTARVVALALSTHPDVLDSVRPGLLQAVRRSIRSETNPATPASTQMTFVEDDRLLSTTDDSITAEVAQWIHDHGVACDDPSDDVASVVQMFTLMGRRGQCGAATVQSARDAVESFMQEFVVSRIDDPLVPDADGCTTIANASAAFDPDANVAGRTPVEWVDWALAELETRGADPEICSQALADASTFVGGTHRAGRRLNATLNEISLNGVAVRETLLADDDALAMTMRLVGADQRPVAPPSPLRTRSLDMLVTDWIINGTAPTFDELTAAQSGSAFAAAIAARHANDSKAPDDCDVVVWLSQQTAGSTNLEYQLQADMVVATRGAECAVPASKHTDQVIKSAQSVLASPGSTIDQTWDAAGALCLVGDKPKLMDTAADKIKGIELGADVASPGYFVHSVELSELGLVIDNGCP